MQSVERVSVYASCMYTESGVLAAVHVLRCFVSYVVCMWEMGHRVVLFLESHE